MDSVSEWDRPSDWVRLYVSSAEILLDGEYRSLEKEMLCVAVLEPERVSSAVNVRLPVSILESEGVYLAETVNVLDGLLDAVFDSVPMEREPVNCLVSVSSDMVRVSVGGIEWDAGVAVIMLESVGEKVLVLL